MGALGRFQVEKAVAGQKLNVALLLSGTRNADKATRIKKPDTFHASKRVKVGEKTSPYVSVSNYYISGSAAVTFATRDGREIQLFKQLSKACLFAELNQNPTEVAPTASGVPPSNSAGARYDMSIRELLVSLDIDNELACAELEKQKITPILLEDVEKATLEQYGFLLGEILTIQRWVRGKMCN